MLWLKVNHVLFQLNVYIVKKQLRVEEIKTATNNKKKLFHAA